MTQAAILAASGSPGTTTGFKNRIINGAMTFNQRGFSGTANAAGGYGLDRWAWRSQTSTSAFSIASSTDAPVGFSNSMLITSLAATTVGTNDYYTISQQIECGNAYDFAWGSSSAKTVTLSFWVKSSLTGTFTGGFNEANSGSVTYGFSYSIPVANTWTYITVTVPGPTIGTWNTALNSYFLAVNFGLGVGSGASTTSNSSWLAQNARVGTGGTSVVSTNGATWYITGVQLEVGTTATNFDFRSIGTETLLCQRYYYQAVPLNSSTLYTVPCCANSSTTGKIFFSFPVTMRSAPTLSATTGTSYYDLYIAAADRLASSLTMDPPTKNNASLVATISGATAGQAGVLYIGSDSAAIGFSAEL